MIKRFIGKILASTAKKKKTLGKRVEIPASVHRIDPQLVDSRAQETVSTLKKAGFEAYIVGGAVRDLLLGLRPKDFDVATNATPEQVKALFRRAFIIGRRFRIVHVVFGRGREHEVIEVSTFRAILDSADASQVQGNEKTSKAELAGMTHAVDQHGRVLRDNVWGSQEEDAARRDFTVNAMYYDPQTQIVVDYHKGFADSQKRVLKLIGDAATRYREDPVRMLRAVRFAAKLSSLQFTLEKKTAQPIAEYKSLLAQIPQSRMFDEVLKLLQTGHAQASLEQLDKMGLARGIYPLLDLFAERKRDPLVRAALQDTDRRIAEGKSAAPYFLLACLLWDEVKTQWHKALAEGEHPVPALAAAIDSVFDRRIGDVSGRGKLAADMREVWMMQPRFDKRSAASAPRMVENLRFRASYDFLRLRAAVGEVDERLADWWLEYSQASDDVRAGLMQQAQQEQRAQQQGAEKKPRRVRSTAPAANNAAKPAKPREAVSSQALDAGAPSHTAEPEAQHSAPGDAAPPAAKRSRRRRKPGNRGSGDSATEEKA